jgi:Apea-like HEPN
MAEAIPSENGYPELKTKLNLFASVLHAVIAKVPAYDMRERNLFLSFVRPWLLPSYVDQSVRQASEPAKEIADRAGFPAKQIAGEIRLIFENDKHLRECCGEPLALASILDDLYVHPATELLLKGASERLQELFTSFNDVVYGQGPYTRITYSHIFNFSSKSDEIDLGPLKIRRLSSQDIALILGGPSMPTQYTFLQPPQVGTSFVVQEESGPVNNLFDWLWNSHAQAINLFRAVQYHKNGLAYVDYSVLHFKPDWVNGLRKFGLFYVGNPRRLPYQNGTKRFELSEDDYAPIRHKLSAYVSPLILGLMADERVQFRQGSLRAGDYYEMSLAEERPSTRLIDLAVALESLFSPDDKQEISFKIALAASNLLGTNAEQRRQIFSELRDLYARRSKIVHGSYDVQKFYEGSFVTHDDIDRWSPYLREGILRFLTMYFRGKRTKKDLESFREDLLMCALDNSRAEGLRKMSDLDVYLEEKFSQQ